MILHNGGPIQSLNELVFFPFDQHSLPLQTGLQLKLIPHKTPCGQTKIVLSPGPPGSPDSLKTVYYGTVQRVGSELWMWYLGQSDDPEWFERVCLATSTDGYHWEKPDLGLVEYRGSRHNNLVDLNQGSHQVQTCVVFHDTDETDESRRFKMAFECNLYNRKFAVAFSPDGLHWHEAEGNPKGYNLEMSGGTKLAGVYYLTGQGKNHPPPLRKLLTYMSYDFENWSDGYCIGLDRGDAHTNAWDNVSGPQVHLGAALWNRGNVVVGMYGMWNGHPSGDRRLTVMHLGMAVTIDGLHYKEPIPGFPMVSAAEDGWTVLPGGFPTVNHFPALIQGQGFENIGDETLFWYAPWPEQVSDGIRVANWERDRLGAFHGFGDHTQPHHTISAPIDLQGDPAMLSVNVSGLGEYGTLQVTVLTEDLRPIPNYTAQVCNPINNGLQQAVTWGNRDAIQGVPEKVRLQFHLSGARPEDVHLYAAYLSTASKITL